MAKSENSSDISIISVKNLSFAYKKDDWILQNVSFEIKPGEITAFTGISGIGKTTLGFVLKGLIPHTIKGILEGEIWVVNQNVKKTKIATLAKDVGMVFQDLNSQLFNSTVKDEVEFGLRNLNLDLKWADEAMDFLGILPLKEKMPMNLSAGQKQRVILASIIATHPKILILDEPSAHLDFQAKQGLLKLLKKINREYGTTIIIIEQDPWLLGELCDYLFYFNNRTLKRKNKEDLIQKSPQWSWIL